MRSKEPSRLFQQVVSAERLHPAYVALCDSPEHAQAKELMESLYARMGDRTGNFVRNFQADGFHSHLFELACFAYLESAGCEIDRSFDAPDFLVTTRLGQRLAIEATTSNPTAGQRTDISIFALKEISGEEIMQKATQEFPKRMLAVLCAKLNHQYHERPQCKDVPIVLFVAPFFEAGVTTYNEFSLLPALYGENGDPLAGNPFFSMNGAEHISGVLFCNGFTVPRFLRRATDWSKLTGIWEGHCFHEEDPDSLYQFRYRMGSTDVPREEWFTGVTYFENPRAKLSLTADALPASCRFAMKRGTLERKLHGFHPVGTITITYVDS